MAQLTEILAYLDAELRTAEIKDYPGAMNGLQLENDGTVSRIVTAVDASLAVVEEAAKVPGTLLLVHHGMFWQGLQPLTGNFFRKISTAIRGNLAIYASHLPLDAHPVIGNNVLLAEAVGLQKIRPILMQDGWAGGVCGEWHGDRDSLANALTSAVERPVHLCPAGPTEIHEVAIITGGAGSQIGKIAKLGIKTFITGEGQHWTYIESEEHSVNTFYAGHYATETFGVRALGDRLAHIFDIKAEFLRQNGGL